MRHASQSTPRTPTTAATIAIAVVAALAMLWLGHATAHAEDTTAVSPVASMGGAYHVQVSPPVTDCSAPGCAVATPKPAKRYGCSWKRSKWRKARWRRAHLKRQRVGIGLTKGHVSADGVESRERGVVARLRLSYRLTAEFEASKTRHHHGDEDKRGETATPTSARQRRMGGALILDVMPWARLSPQLAFAGGVTRTGSDDAFIAQRYAEVGAGLSLRLGKRLRVEGNFRMGRQDAAGDDKTLSETIGVSPANNQDRYMRTRVNVMLFF